MSDTRIASPDATTKDREVDRRIAQRRRSVRRDRRRKRLRRTLAVVVALMVVGAAVLVERSALVALERVEVTGTERLAASAVRDAADLELGASTLRLSLDTAELRVEQLALVDEAEISRVDPVTVAVHVIERTPVAVATRRGREDSVLVDHDGVVLPPAGFDRRDLQPAGSDGLAHIVVTDAELPAPGERVDTLPALANAHAAMSALSGPLRTQVERYVAGPDDELVLVLERGTRVRLGAAERMAEKVRALGAVLGDLGDIDVAWIDVRAPSAPSVSS